VTACVTWHKLKAKTLLLLGKQLGFHAARNFNHDAALPEPMPSPTAICLRYASAATQALAAVPGALGGLHECKDQEWKSTRAEQENGVKVELGA
jgi:hypothetical protein